MHDRLEERVLVLAPTAADAALTEAILNDAHLPCEAFASMSALVRATGEGAGAILLTEEVLVSPETEELIAVLRAQPAWSDLPVLLLCGSRAATAPSWDLRHFGNITTLERPVRVPNLVSALRSAIRARRRQYQIRDQLTALKQAEERLREADRRKDEFLAILAHELRNPLAPVRNAAHLLKLQEAVDPGIRDPIDMIERQVAQMSRLIDDLLDVGRISRGVLELRRNRFEYAEIAKAAVEACHHELHARRHHLSLTLPNRPVFLDIDRERLIQVISNLITNAAKYTRPGGHIQLTATVTGEMLEVSVKDDGIGIPAEKLDEIFELFAQVDRSFDRQGGLGIGLTLVRQLVELHGGSIEARSEGVGRGSEFVFRLPIAAAPAQAPPAAAAGRRSSRLRRILVVDDNRDAAESLGGLLQLLGYEVCEAFDGEEAMRRATEFLPDVALVDIAMPKMDGYEVARAFRRDPRLQRVHLIALTGFGQDSDRDRSRSAGFDEHLVKPFPPDALDQLLAAAGQRPE
jgi:signal transduction histidine kinase